MTASALRRGRRRLSLLVSIGLVLLMGALGVVAGQRASAQARDVHRQDRLELQQVLSQLTAGAEMVLASQLQSELADVPTWSTSAADPATARALQEVVTSARSFDAGAVLVDGLGQPLGAYTVGGALPASDDPGWDALRAAIARGDGSLPISDVLLSGSVPMLALGLPVPLSDGSRGLVIALWSVQDSQLQQFTVGLRYDDGYIGLVVDGNQVVLASTHPETLGKPMPFPEARAALAADPPAGVLDTRDGGQDRVTIHAPVGTTGWTGLGTQEQSSFEGALIRSSWLVQGAVVALLLFAGGALVLMHRKREAALEVVALHDELTGLYNRRGWMVLAEHELNRARRQGTARMLLFVDLDGLKQVNDVLGHRQGDHAIMAAAQVLLQASRATDLVGRIGGDEFVLLMSEDTVVDGARRRLGAALEAYNASSDADFELRLSVGAEVWFPEAALTLEELVRRADAEMYAEKSRRPRRSEGVVREHAEPIVREQSGADTEPEEQPAARP